MKPQTTYKEIQAGGVIMGSISAALLLILYLFPWSSLTWQEILYRAILMAIMVLVGVLFYQLKTDVNPRRVIVTFGIGLIRKKIPIDEIRDAKVVRNKWYFGWGIRYIFTGWLWNISGLNAVEITFKNRRSVFRIGTGDPVRLQSAILACIAAHEKGDGAH